jgi:outer membrane lipoprotein-sorting protein
MKKLLTLGLSVLLLGSLVSSFVNAQTADEILKKMIEAGGGRKALEAIKDTTVSGDAEMPAMGISGSVTTYHKEPGMTRQDMEFMGMVMTQAFDGEIAWFTNPQTGTVDEAPAEMQEYSKKGALEMGNSLLLDPEKFGASHEFKGKETIEGKEYLVLERAFESGDISTLFIDPQTYYVMRQRQMSMDLMGGESEQEIVFSDYKKVEGIPYPFSMTIYQGGEELAIITMTEVKFNSGLEDSFFKMEK